MKKAIWIAIFLVAMLCGMACGETVDTYAIVPAQARLEALLRYTFDQDVDKAQKEEDREWVFYDLPNTDGLPFCGLDDTELEGQARVIMYKACILGKDHAYAFGEVEPTGVAKCDLTREEAVRQATAIMDDLDLGPYTLQSVTAYAGQEGHPGAYKVAYGQLLNGKSVYWSASSAGRNGWIESNRIEVEWSDCGLVRLQGYWSTYDAQGSPQEAMTGEQAAEAFAAAGIEARETELCYLMQRGPEAVVATPAYRFQNAFIHAVTGEMLQ